MVSVPPLPVRGIKSLKKTSADPVEGQSRAEVLSRFRRVMEAGSSYGRTLTPLIRSLATALGAQFFKKHCGAPVPVS